MKNRWNNGKKLNLLSAGKERERVTNDQIKKLKPNLL